MKQVDTIPLFALTDILHVQLKIYLAREMVIGQNIIPHDTLRGLRRYNNIHYMCVCCIHRAEPMVLNRTILDYFNPSLTPSVSI